MQNSLVVNAFETESSALLECPAFPCLILSIADQLIHTLLMWQFAAVGAAAPSVLLPQRVQRDGSVRPHRRRKSRHFANVDVVTGLVYQHL